jgi:hypothetical protein
MKAGDGALDTRPDTQPDIQPDSQMREARLLMSAGNHTGGICR